MARVQKSLANCKKYVIAFLSLGISNKVCFSKAILMKLLEEGTHILSKLFKLCLALRKKEPLPLGLEFKLVNEFFIA